MSTDDPQRASVGDRYPDISPEPVAISLEGAESVRLGLYDEAYADADNVSMPDDPRQERDEETA